MPGTGKSRAHMEEMTKKTTEVKKPVAKKKTVTKKKTK